MKEMKELTCIICPNGCTLTVTGDGDNIRVSGSKCVRGEKFAVAEVTNPMRTICSTVRTAYKDAPVLPVRVSAEIPKEKIFDVIRELNKIIITEPVACGGTVIENVLGLGVDIIATSDILKFKEM